MTAPSTPPADDAGEDQLRRHPESPAEGADDAAAEADQPREHSEDPAEG